MSNIISLADYIRNHPLKSLTHERTLAHLDAQQSYQDELMRCARKIFQEMESAEKPRAKRKTRNRK